ncbi:MAG TPA: hypothetical protein VF465_17705, partial [Flavobacterium sp.]|uniref:glycoside hydrolase family 78 protein n=1 Tax=Flavobacterium sp. TaxID=239 RepID=UPI002ED5DAB5
MNQIKTLLLFVTIFSLPLCSQQKENKALLQINNLKVENAVTPIGLDLLQPVFSWQMKTVDKNRGYYQTAYQIIVKNNE